MYTAQHILQAHKAGAPALGALGVDEVGRGAGAGPVLVCAARLRPGVRSCDLPTDLTDSKKLTRSQRERIADRLTGLVAYALMARSNRAIDGAGIRATTLYAMTAAADRLDPSGQCGIVVDGRDLPDNLVRPAVALPRADGQVIEVAAAAVLAKVVRDRMMRGLARRYPGYLWERNAGYLTPAQIDAIENNGLTPHHRTTFSARFANDRRTPAKT